MQIDNTGGSAVTHWLKQQAAKRNVSYTELFSLDFHQNWTDWNASEPKLPDGSRCATDTEYCCVACVADAWKRLLLLLQQPRPPLAVVVQHHTSAGFAEWMQHSVIGPLRALLQPKGCRVVVTTAMRYPPSHLLSIRASELEIWHRFGSGIQARLGPAPKQIDEAAAQVLRLDGAKNGIAAWRQAMALVCAAHCFRQPSWYTQSPTQLGATAAAALRAFDIVGRTEELDAFIGAQAKVLGWALGSLPTRQNPTDSQYLAAMQRAAGYRMDGDGIYETQALNDLDLYRTFCAS